MNSLVFYLYMYILQFSARMRILLKSLVFIDLCIVTSAKKVSVNGFRFPPRCKSDLRSSRSLHNVDWVKLDT